MGAVMNELVVVSMGTRMKLEEGRQVNPNTGGGAQRWAVVAVIVAAGVLEWKVEWKAEDGEEMIRSWKAEDGELVQNKTTKLDKI